jgi:hypothetical protein
VHHAQRRMAHQRRDLHADVRGYGGEIRE